MSDVIKSIRNANRELDSIISTINIACIAMDYSKEKVMDDISLFLSHLWTSCCELQGRYDSILSEIENKGSNKHDTK